LNHTLLLSHRAKLRDDQILAVVRQELAAVDPDAARLIHILFSCKVAGESPDEEAMGAAMKKMDKKGLMISNLARKLLRHPEFIMHRIERTNTSEARLLRKQMKHIRNVYEDGTKVRENQSVTFKEDFGAASIVFSNNDLYACVVGAKEFAVVEMRNGMKRQYKLPKAAAGLGQDSAGLPLAPQGEGERSKDESRQTEDDYESPQQKGASSKVTSDRNETRMRSAVSQEGSGKSEYGSDRSSPEPGGRKAASAPKKRVSIRSAAE
jgi:hypothetical protein